MHHFSRILAIALAAACGLPAFAQTLAPDAGASAQQQRIYRGSRIIGSKVRDTMDKTIGEIKDLVLDPRRGEILYAIVSFGGVMGVGRKFHPVPWSALAPGDDGRYYVLQADKETIALAPGFDKAKWPDMTDQAWHAEIERYWSRKVGKGPAGTNNPSTGGVSNPKEQSRIYGGGG